MILYYTSNYSIVYWTQLGSQILVETLSSAANPQGVNNLNKYQFGSPNGVLL